MANRNKQKIIMPPPKPKSFWYNVWDYDDDDYPFQVFIGPRGPGKSYSALYGAVKRDIKFIYTRRTQDDVDLICDATNDSRGNPFAEINKNEGLNLGFRKDTKKTGMLYHRDIDPENNGKFIYKGKPLALLNNIFSMAAARSSSFSEYTHWIYDEFIPEESVRKVRGEGTAPLMAYETIARNREFNGGTPLKFWLIANSLDIWNPVFRALEIVNIYERMVALRQEDVYLPERGLALHWVIPSREFSDMKKNTALAKLMRGTQFYDMIYNNEFTENNFTLIKNMSIKGMLPLFSLDNGTCYKKKGESFYYVSYSPATHISKYNTKNKQDVKSALYNYGGLINQAFMGERIYFESYELKETYLDTFIS